MNPVEAVEVTQADIDLANLCVPSALMFADAAEHIADARKRAAQHIARYRNQVAEIAEAHQGGFNQAHDRLCRTIAQAIRTAGGSHEG